MRISDAWRVSLKAVFVAGFVVFAIGAPAWAGIYTWKDENGKTHFTDNPARIPPQYRSSGKEGYRQLKEDRAFSTQGAPPVVLSGNGASIPLVKNAGNNFLVEALLNGKVKANLILDTGASMVTLSSTLAKKLGIPLGGVQPELAFSTAGGQVWMPLIALDKVRLGEVEIPLVEASVNPADMGPIDGLLGMSFFSNFKFEIDQANSLLNLRPLGNSGELAWGGQPASWWQSKHDDLESLIKQARQEAEGMKQGGNPKAKNVEKKVDFYISLFNKFQDRATRAGLPQKYWSRN